MSSSVSPCPSLFSSFFLSSLCLFRLPPCAIHVQGVPFSQPPTHWCISFFFLLSFSQVHFFHLSTTLLQTSDVSPPFRSLCFFFASVNDPGVSLRPHPSRGLYCVHARELRRELQPRRAGARKEFPARYLRRSSLGLRVGVPATEQISNK